jgi:hypothetical protein
LGVISVLPEAMSSCSCVGGWSWASINSYNSQWFLWCFSM